MKSEKKFARLIIIWTEVCGSSEQHSIITSRWCIMFRLFIVQRTKHSLVSFSLYYLNGNFLLQSSRQQQADYDLILTTTTSIDFWQDKHYWVCYYRYCCSSLWCRWWLFDYAKTIQKRKNEKEKKEEKKKTYFLGLDPRIMFDEHHQL
jgi:hypothetical protein